jgi:uncharacterized membrane protein
MSTTTRRTVGIWWLALTALAIAVYAPLPYLTTGVDGLAAGGHEIAANYAARPGWVRVALYIHITGAATALLLAPVQLAAWVRARVPRLHRVSGRFVIAGMFVGGTAGLALAPVNYAGPVGTLGFGTLAILSLAFPVLGLLAIRRGDIAAHRRWMLRAFAAIYAGVTLRLWLPVLATVLGDFDLAYSIVPFLAWVPNLLVAEWVLGRPNHRSMAMRRLVPALAGPRRPASAYRDRLGRQLRRPVGRYS